MNGPIDYDSPLGISKRELAKVLGANLALLLIAYAVALIFTMSGSDAFLLNFHSDDLQRIEDTLRSWHVFPFVQIGFATIECTLVGCYIAKAKPKWWYPLWFFAADVGLDLTFTNCIGHYPGIVSSILMLSLWVFGIFFLNKERPKEKWYVYLFRLAIALSMTFTLNEGIALFRLRIGQLWLRVHNSIGFVLNIEYYLALSLALGFLTLVIPWKKKGGMQQWTTHHGVSGSSQPSTTSSQKSSQTARTELPLEYRKRIRRLKIKVIAIQTSALVVIAALPWFTGKGVEFALVYASFCLTRLMLGFNRSLHFKSELSCVTIGALCFWALTYLTPSVEASVIMSLVYGAALALGFRLYWELHDLMMYHKTSKTDRYAMLYVVFKGNCDPKHINGVMRAKGYADKDEIKMVQMYMQKDKVEYIAEYLTFAKITIEKKLTDIANDLYSRR